MTKRDIQADPPTLTEMFAELPAEVKQQRLAELGSAILMSFDAISDAGVHSEVKGDDALNAYIRTYERMKAELADLRKRHGDNLEFIKTLVADKAVNQSAKQELAKVFGDLTITELAQKAIEAKGFLDQQIEDWAATDTYCRAKAAEVLPEFEVYGDKESVPPIEAVVDKLVECVSPKRKEKENERC